MRLSNMCVGYEWQKSEDDFAKISPVDSAKALRFPIAIILSVFRRQFGLTPGERSTPFRANFRRLTVSAARQNILHLARYTATGGEFLFTSLRQQKTSLRFIPSGAQRQHDHQSDLAHFDQVSQPVSPTGQC